MGQKRSIKKAQKLEKELHNLKRFSVDVMKMVYNTVKSIHVNSKQIMLKNFDQDQVNILAKHAPSLIKRIN